MSKTIEQNFFSGPNLHIIMQKTQTMNIHYLSSTTANIYKFFKKKDTDLRFKSKLAEKL